MPASSILPCWLRLAEHAQAVPAFSKKEGAVKVLLLKILEFVVFTYYKYYSILFTHWARFNIFFFFEQDLC